MNHIPSNPTSPLVPDALVNDHFFNNNVKGRDICCNLTSALVGLAFIVAAIFATYCFAIQNGWSLKMAPIYGLVGLFGFTGATLSFFSIKWMVERCYKLYMKRKSAALRH